MKNKNVFSVLRCFPTRLPDLRAWGHGRRVGGGCGPGWVSLLQVHDRVPPQETLLLRLTTLSMQVGTHVYIHQPMKGVG